MGSLICYADFVPKQAAALYELLHFYFLWFVVEEKKSLPHESFKAHSVHHITSHESNLLSLNKRKASSDEPVLHNEYYTFLQIFTDQAPQ